jgi:predicted Zn-dependent peptidase
MIIFKQENLAAYLLMEKISREEFERAKNEFLAESEKENLINIWLDVDTFQTRFDKDELQKINTVSLVEVQKVAERLIKEPTVTILAVKSKAAAKQ